MCAILGTKIVQSERKCKFICEFFCANRQLNIKKSITIPRIAALPREASQVAQLLDTLGAEFNPIHTPKPSLHQPTLFGELTLN